VKEKIGATMYSIPEGIQGIYANSFVLRMSPEQWVLEFGYQMPGATEATIQYRIVMNPAGAQALYELLRRNVEKPSEEPRKESAEAPKHIGFVKPK
jgi:hypothetical protein